MRLSIDSYGLQVQLQQANVTVREKSVLEILANLIEFWEREPIRSNYLIDRALAGLEGWGKSLEGEFSPIVSICICELTHFRNFFSFSSCNNSFWVHRRLLRPLIKRSSEEDSVFELVSISNTSFPPKKLTYVTKNIGFS